MFSLCSEPSAPIHEEVFAEDYDDPDQVKPPAASSHGNDDVPMATDNQDPDNQDDLFDDKENRAEESDILIHDAMNCPNRPNKFHTCSAYCAERWGLKKFASEAEMDRLRLRMLRKYPLPDGWMEVGDPDT